ncbi:MAG: enoyl-CoA hydratase/isomerase family protein, partial [Desulfatiglandales bacterium]
GTQRLSRLVGKAMAKELCLTGVQITAQEAKEIGLVNKVFPKERLMDETLKTAKILASKGKVALRAIKRCIDRGFDVDLRDGCYLEAESFATAFSSPDAKEGLSAFLEKRQPKFEGELQ